MPKYIIDTSITVGFRVSVEAESETEATDEVYGMSLQDLQSVAIRENDSEIIDADVVEVIRR
jgi:hypothetical protein